MKIIQKLIYLISVIAIFLALYGVQDIMIGYVIDYLTPNIFIKIGIFMILNIFVNPFLTYYIINNVGIFKNKWQAKY